MRNMKNTGVGDEEEDNEGYLDPNDLSIIDDKTWEPSDEEILSYALKLGYDLENDPDELFEVAYYYLKCPLPEGWRRAIYKETKELMYINMEDGEIEIATEIEEMARQAYLEKKEEYLKKIGQKNEELSNKVVPRKKIPPINPLGKSSQNGFTNNHLPPVKNVENKLNLTDNSLSEFNKSKEEEESDNSSFLKIDYKKYENGDINLKNNSKIEKKYEDKDMNIKSVLNKNNEKNDNLKKKDYDDEEEDYDSEEEEEEEDGEEDEDDDEKKEIIHPAQKIEEKKIIDEKKVNEVIKEEKKINEERKVNNIKIKEKKINDTKKEDKKIENKKEDNNSNLLKKEKVNEVKKEEQNENKNIIKIDDKKDGEQKQTKDDLEKQKKEYFEKKINELKEFENKIKEDYKKEKEKYQKQKGILQEKYNKNLEEQIKKEKNKIDKQLKDKISLYETQLKSNNDKEINKYKKESENEMKKNINTNVSNKNKEEEELKKTTKKKENLLSEIEKLKKLNELYKSRKKEKNESLKKSKNLLDEKNKIQKNNMLKKHELDIKELENNFEQDFQNNKNLLSQKINPNKSVEVANFLVNKNSQLYENYQKILEDEYEINCKVIKQELSLNKKRELDNFENSMKIEKNEKIKSYQKDIAQLEKDYFESLSKIRENSNRLTNQTNEILKDKFNGTLENYDIIKKKLINEDEEIIQKFIEKLKENINRENNIDRIEMLIEEFLYELKGEINLKYQKYKNLYDLLENELKYKMLSMNYLLEITNYIIKTVVDTANKDINHEEIIQNILKYSKDKLTTYKFKFSKEKDNKLYPFLKSLKILDSNKLNKNDFNVSDVQKSFEQNIIQLPINQEKSRLTHFVPSERYSEPNETQNEKVKNIKTDNKEPIESINENNNLNELDVYVIDTNNNIIIPLLSDFYLRKLDTEEIGLYTDITLFLKNEYIKIDNINKYGTTNNFTNIKFNLIILDKIKLYTEDTFNFIQKNISNQKNKIFFKEKLQLLVNNIADYRKNFLIDETKINKPPISGGYLQNQNNIGQNYTNINNITNINPIISEDKMNLTSKSFNYNHKKIDNKKKENDIEKNHQFSNYSIKENKNFQPIESVRISGRFNSFYTHYNPSILGDGLNTPFSHEFFNYKKNKYEIDSKLSLLSYK